MTSVATRPFMTAYVASDRSYEAPNSAQYGSSLVFQMEVIVTQRARQVRPPPSGDFKVSPDVYCFQGNEECSEQGSSSKLAEHIRNVKDRVSAFASPSSSFASRVSTYYFWIYKSI
jgi:hypothetical protein